MTVQIAKVEEWRRANSFPIYAESFPALFGGRLALCDARRSKCLRHQIMYISIPKAHTYRLRPVEICPTLTYPLTSHEMTPSPRQ